MIRRVWEPLTSPHRLVNGSHTLLAFPSDEHSEERVTIYSNEGTSRP